MNELVSQLSINFFLCSTKWIITACFYIVGPTHRFTISAANHKVLGPHEPKGLFLDDFPAHAKSARRARNRADSDSRSTTGWVTSYLVATGSVTGSVERMPSLSSGMDHIFTKWYGPILTESRIGHVILNSPSASFYTAELLA